MTEMTPEELDFPNLQGAFQISIFQGPHGTGFAVDVPAGGTFRLTGAFGVNDPHDCVRTFPVMEVMVTKRLRVEYGVDQCDPFTLLHIDRPVQESQPGGGIYVHRNAPFYPGGFSNWSQIRDAIIRANARYGVDAPIPDHQ